MTEHVRDGRRRDATPRGGRESPHLPPDRGFYGQTLNSIFLPAAGYGANSNLNYLGSYGNYWSSTPYSVYSSYAWYLDFNSSNFCRDNYYRYSGRSIRPVRGFAK